MKDRVDKYYIGRFGGNVGVVEFFNENDREWKEEIDFNGRMMRNPCFGGRKQMKVGLNK